MPLIISALILIFFLILLGFFIALFSEKQERNSIFGGLETVLFLVTMPKNEPKKEGQFQEEEKVLIAQMEQIFANFLYLKKPKMFQGPHSIALEIASETGSTDISFYVCVPKYLETAFEKYVQGVYPRAIVDKVPQDYTVFEPQGATAGAYLKLKENSLFPISTYQKLEKDPLSTITNNLSKIAANEGAAIQLVIRPLFAFNLRKKGEKALQKIREGKHVRTAVSEAMQDTFVSLLTEFFKSSAQKPNDVQNMQKKEQGFDQVGYDAIQSKIQKQPFETNIRLVASAPSLERAEDILNHLIGAFSQFSLSVANSLEPVEVKGGGLKNFVYDFSFRIFNEKQKNILNTEELASIYHFPTHFTETPYIKSSKSRVAPPPVDLPEKGINLIGKALFRGEEKKVYFASKDDRRRHFYIIGQTGTGKSAFLQEMIRQDIANGEGVAVIDPHGELIEATLANIPKNRVDDVVLFEPFDQERPMGLNMLEYDTPEQKDFAVQEMVAIFYKLFPPEIIGPMFEHYMRNAMLALMADKNNPGTLVEIPKMFTDPAFLQERLAKVSDPVVKNFWIKEWAQTTGNTRSDMLGYVVSKVGRFIENEMMRNIIGQGKSGFDLAKIMDEGKIFLANLSKGLTGEVNSSLLGLILVSKMQMAAMKRARVPESQRKDFYLYIDEFQNVTTPAISSILSEARKYRLSLNIAHQYITQLEENIKNAVFGNVGSMAIFRVGADDAEFLSKQVEPTFSASDILKLENRNAYLRLLVNGTPVKPFNIETLAPEKGDTRVAEHIKELSYLKYGRARQEVESEILAKYQVLKI